MNELEATRAKLKCLEMVEGTGLDWWECVKQFGYIFQYPAMLDGSCYEFALGVVEGKPVWEGDTLYCNGIPIHAVPELCNFKLKSLSWSPPKPATLMVELPIDVVESWLNYHSPHEAIAAAEFVGKALRKALEQMK